MFWGLVILGVVLNGSESVENRNYILSSVDPRRKAYDRSLREWPLNPASWEELFESLVQKYCKETMAQSSASAKTDKWNATDNLALRDTCFERLSDLRKVEQGEISSPRVASGSAGKDVYPNLLFLLVCNTYWFSYQKNVDEAVVSK